MRTSIKLFFSFLFVYLIYAVSVSAVSAASLKFDQTSYSGDVGTTFDVNVIVSPGTDSISGTDAHVLYDSTLLQVQNVTDGTYFPSVNSSQSTGKVSIYASVNDPATSKTGDGTIATITFKVLKNGTGTLQYYCDTSTYNTSKIVKNDINATNIIVCSSDGTATVTGGTGGTGVTNAAGGASGGGIGDSGTPTTEPLLTPTSALTQLPVTGTVSNLSVFAFVGTALVVIGGIVRYIL